MVADIFLDFFRGILTTVFAVLPPMSVLPVEWTDTWVWFAGAISNWLYLMPRPDVLVLIPPLVLAFLIAQWTFDGAIFIYRLIRG